MVRGSEYAPASSAPPDPSAVRPIDSLPSALAEFESIRERIDGFVPVLCLDFDGTLSPIVDDPASAQLLEGMDRVLRRLVERTHILVLSGRDAYDVRARVGIEGVLVAGSHGFDVLEADGRHEPNAEAVAYLPHLDALEARLRAETASVVGAEVDRKRFGVAVHDRRVAEEDFDRLWATVNEAEHAFPMLRPMRGKRVTEFLPEIDWNKGRALLWLLGRAGYRSDLAVPVCIGDDVTDEDALRVVRGIGVGIVVGTGSRPSAATYAVRDPGEVLVLLERLAAFLEAREPHEDAPAAS
ncbi:MAG: trehalose-phosphatase [Dehalococcoidia bacterium]